MFILTHPVNFLSRVSAEHSQTMSPYCSNNQIHHLKGERYLLGVCLPIEKGIEK
jgi:hypothetical protein